MSKVLVVQLIWGCCSSALHVSIVQHEYSLFLGRDPKQVCNVAVLADVMQTNMFTAQLQVDGRRALVGVGHATKEVEHASSIHPTFVGAPTQVTRRARVCLHVSGDGCTQNVGR